MDAYERWSLTKDSNKRLWENFSQSGSVIVHRRWTLTRGGRWRKILTRGFGKISVFWIGDRSWEMDAYERWSLTRGFGKISVFWIGDRSWEMDAYERWSLTRGFGKISVFWIGDGR